METTASMEIRYEHTDTFGGQANYSWAKRGTIKLPKNVSDLKIVRDVKKALGLTGIPCHRENWSGTIVLRPKGICQIVFIDNSY